MNRFLDRHEKRQLIGEGGRQSERKLAKRLDARLRPGSGSKTGHKGDMAVGDVLIEAKSTSNDSLGVKLDWLLKIAHEAVSEAKTPVLTVTFTDANGAPRANGEWALVPLRVFKEWLDVLDTV